MKTIMKNKWLFYLLSFTWGLPLNLLGLIVSFVLIITGHKPKKYGNNFYFEVGSRWGGFEMGVFFVVNKVPTKHILDHEMGHGYQNLIFGPLTPFIVTIPSAIRYWYREIIYKTNKEKYWKMPDYDSIWFEAQANKLGEKYWGNFYEILEVK